MEKQAVTLKDLKREMQAVVLHSKQNTLCLLLRLHNSYRSYFMCSIARKGFGLCSISFPFL